MNKSIVLSKKEVEALTGYEIATKQLNVLHGRGFVRAFIDRNGRVVLERSHYEAVTRGELHHQVKTANLSVFQKRA